MQQEGVQPVAVIFTGVLNACASIVALEVGRHICESDVFVCSSFIDMYAKCGSIEDAWNVLNRMPTHGVVACTAMIMGM